MRCFAEISLHLCLSDASSSLDLDYRFGGRNHRGEVASSHHARRSVVATNLIAGHVKLDGLFKVVSHSEVPAFLFLYSVIRRKLLNPAHTGIKVHLLEGGVPKNLGIFAKTTTITNTYLGEILETLP